MRTSFSLRKFAMSFVVAAASCQLSAIAQQESSYPDWCKQSLQDWAPYPEKADLLVVTAHPDDEGIFFGGALPYYTQVRDKATILIGMTGDESNHAGFNRREELERAAWHYGVQHQPINYQYPDVNSDIGNQWDPAGGGQGVVNRLAEEIRRFKPDVLLTHDFNGEYGHAAHRFTASALVDAYEIAADPSVDLGGLAPWQAQKLYIHRLRNPGGSEPTPSPTVNPNTGYMYHSWEETFDELGGKSSREIANEALQCHLDAIKVWPDLQVSSRHVSGEVFDGHHAEDWGLYASEVGPDSVDSDFFQNVIDDFFVPALLGDLDGSGAISLNDWLILKANAGEDLTGLSREAAYLRGDLDFDNDNDIEDFRILRSIFESAIASGATGLVAPVIPEPTGLGVLLSAFAALCPWRRRSN